MWWPQGKGGAVQPGSSRRGWGSEVLGPKPPPKALERAKQGLKTAMCRLFEKLLHNGLMRQFFVEGDPAFFKSFYDASVVHVLAVDRG